MDFLKECSTNVHAIEDLSTVRYRRLAHTGGTLSENDRWSGLQDALTALRQQNVLCSSADDDLYIFENTQHTPDPTLEPFAAAEEDTLDNTSTKQTPSGIVLRYLLLDAVEGGISFNLAQEGSVTHIAPWTWVYSIVDEECDQCLSYVMKIHHRFASSGGLFLIPEIKPTSWLPLREYHQSGREVLVAPFSTLAVVSPSESDDIIAGTFWKASVSQTLASEGIHLDEDVEWVAVRCLQDNDSIAFLWPSEQLLVADSSLKTELAHVEAVEPSHSWRSWFLGTDDSRGFRNPLSLAEEWFNESTNRAQLAVASTGVGANETTMDAANTFGEDADMTSPPYTQQSMDQQGSIAGLYPTPPDGVNQGQQAFSSIAAGTPSVTQGEVGYTLTENFPSLEDTQGKSQEFQPVNTGGFPMEEDELFGDSEEMEFVDHDIGDADFSFFDEPDDEPLAVPSGDSDIAEISQAEDTQMFLPDPELLQVADTMAKETQDKNSEHLAMQDQEMTSRSPDVDDPIHEEDMNNVRASFPGPEFDRHTANIEKPLDPFGIRERLLPPPVPASVAQTDPKNAAVQRRDSTFAPIVFRESLRLGSKYTVGNVVEENSAPAPESAGPSISLPPTRKKSRLLKKKPEDNSDSERDNSESEEDSYESCSSETDENLPPKLPWDNRKRKRHPGSNYSLSDNCLRSPWPEDGTSDRVFAQSSEQIVALIKRLLIRPKAEAQVKLHTALSGPHSTQTPINKLAVIDELFELRKEDLVYIAQIVLEQAATNLVPQLSASLESGPIDLSLARSLYCEKAVGQAVARLFAQSEVCDLAKVSLTRDPQPPQRAAQNTGKGPQGQPRPLQRAENLMVGPDFFPLQPPYVKIQRGMDSWEMLSTCLSFWETLGLGPANGPKGVRAFCVFPSSYDLQGLVGHFIAELGNAYESCKLGSHSYIRNTNGNNELDNYEDGMAPVEIFSNSSLEAALKAYAATCTELGKALSYISHREVDRTIVVYIVNPFPGSQAKQYLCACFWMLFKAYRDNLPKAHRRQCGSDIVLQLLPIDTIADSDMLVVPDATLMATLAREVYDRCPPSATAQAPDHTSTLPIRAAPSVELASAAPKRIGFQLSPDPPNGLLHEGSILHIAYSCTPDRQWLTATWLDNTGQYYSSSAFPLRGRTFAAGAEDLWEQTREIIAARQVTWRIFLVASDKVLEKSILRYWRSLTSSKPRQQPLCVTMLCVQTDPEMRLFTPDLQVTANTDQGFLTPASTPQATSFTSPAEIGTHNANANANAAPPTPASSEMAFSLAENDPDAHLVDVTDESWGVMLSPKLTNLASFKGLANGALFRRKEVEQQPGDEVPSLGVSLHWTIQVKPNGSVDEGSVKQSELTLREVLKMYRNLSLLTKAKGLDNGRTRMAPLHVAAAIRGAEWLDGMLGVG